MASPKAENFSTQVLLETTNLVLILGSTVNDNTGSEGLSCQSEVIGLLIVLQNKRRL